MNVGEEDPIYPEPPVASYDPAPMLTRFSVLMVGAITGLLGLWITIFLVMGKPVGTEVWAAFAGMVGWITAKCGSIFDNRFGSTRQSAAKDATISRLADK